MKLKKEENQLLWKIVAEAWLKKDFRDRFLREPNEVLKNAGLQLAGITLITTTVIQGSLPEIVMKDKTLEISLPPAPIELSDLDIVAEMDISQIPSVFVCLKLCSC